MPMRLHDIPGPHTASVTLPAVGSSSAAFSFPIFVAPWDAKVTSVKIAFGSTMVGDASNRFDFTVYNRGTDGTGTTAWGSLVLGSGTSATAFVPQSVFSLAAGTALSEGEVLDLYYAKQGNGFDVARAVVQVTFIGA